MTKKNPQIAFLNPETRTGKIPLEHVLVVDGKNVSEIIVRRLTGGEIAALAEGGNAEMGNSAFLATFTDQPIEVIDALDADDLTALTEKVTDFLPRRIREAMEQAAARVPAPDSGDTPSS